MFSKNDFIKIKHGAQSMERIYYNTKNKHQPQKTCIDTLEKNKYEAILFQMERLLNGNQKKSSYRSQNHEKNVKR